MNNEAFEKWWSNNYSNLDHRDILRTSEKAWQVAKADSEQEIAELKDRLNEVSADWQVKYYELEKVQAHINDLREALNDCYYEVNTNFAKSIKELLATTPAQSLQEHDNEVIEKCAEICESSDRHRGEYFAAKIRALKGIV